MCFTIISARFEVGGKDYPAEKFKEIAVLSSSFLFMASSLFCSSLSRPKAIGKAHLERGDSPQFVKDLVVQASNPTHSIQN